MKYEDFKVISENDDEYSKIILGICRDYVPINEYDKFIKRLNYSNVLLFDDFEKITAKVIKTLLIDAYTNPVSLSIAKDCALLSTIDKDFDGYFKTRGKERKIYLAKILAKYTFSKNNESIKYARDFEVVYKYILKILRVNKVEIDNYVKSVKQDKIYQLDKCNKCDDRQQV